MDKYFDEESLRPYIGKKVHITFESKQDNETYSLIGILVGVGFPWTHFADAHSDYPSDHRIEFVNTLRIRSVEEVNNDA